MSKWSKILFALSFVLLIVSYPACQWGERKAKTEMAKYSPEFVAAHEFDFIFIRWVLPGMWDVWLGSVVIVGGDHYVDR